MTDDGDRLSAARAAWDVQADRFDEEPDHGLRDPVLRAAWRRLLVGLMGPDPLRIADLGCGTGTLSLLLAELGHEVTGLDLSPRMLERAQAKAGPGVLFVEGDAARPDLPVGVFGAVLCRHLLWALPDPARVLERWAALLVPGGRLCLVEGVWHTGAGLSADRIRAALPEDLRLEAVRELSSDTALWGGPVADDRYVLTARRVA